MNRLLGLILPLTLVSLLTSIESVQSGELSRGETCKSLGRVIQSYDSGIAIGTELCEDGELLIGDGLKVNVVCFEKSEARWLSAGRYNIRDLCAYQGIVKNSCWFTFDIACNRSTTRITLLSPRSSAVLSTPDLKWNAIEGAAYYEVFVQSDSGEEYHLETETPTAKLSTFYPWTQGNLYRIRILASAKDRVLSEAKFTIRIPSEQEISELETTIHTIESNNFPVIEKARLVDSVYMSSGLIYESIEYLESASIATKSLAIARILAYRYSEIQEPKKAEENYQIVYAESPDGSEDKKFAKEMLQRIAQYQARANYQ